MEEIFTIKIEKAYGTYTLLKDGVKFHFNTIEDIGTFMDSNKTLEGDVESTTYVFDEESIEEAMDLTMMSALIAWGNKLYVGDAIKIEIKATYEPEDK